MRIRLSLARVLIAVFVCSLLVQSGASANTSPSLRAMYVSGARHFVPEDVPWFMDEPGVEGDGSGVAASPLGGAGNEDTGASPNVQVNDPAGDHVQQVIVTPAGSPTTRMFEFAIQSETSIATAGDSIVVAYNTSNNQPVTGCVFGGAPVAIRCSFSHRFLSGYSVSHDGGRTWTTRYLTPNAGSPFTFGDPALATDRRGNFYYASLGATAGGAHGAVIVGKSTDGGNTFAPAAVAAVDDGSDKEWIAVGPDPTNRSRDNIYVPWTSFKNPTAVNPGGASELWLARSTNGGTSWTTQRLFAPVDPSGGNDPTKMSSFIQFANPVVDKSTGRLYIPFLHFSNTDADLIKVLVSDDGGLTFRFLKFNIPGALDPDGFPNVSPGRLVDCGNTGGLRLALVAGTPTTGRFGLPRFQFATRLVSQPAAAAAEGRLFLAFNSSTDATFGTGGGSTIRSLFSRDGGAHFVAQTVVGSTGADPQHVHPAIAIDRDAKEVDVAYYVQQSNAKLRVDLRSGSVEDGGIDWDDTSRLSSVAFDLIPSNITLSATTTTNFDRTIRPCYNIGEYMSITRRGGRTIAAWGDNRRTWTPPSPISGVQASPANFTHQQPDVFFARGGED